MLPHTLNAFTHVYRYKRKVSVAVWASLKLGHMWQGWWTSAPCPYTSLKLNPCNPNRANFRLNHFQSLFGVWVWLLRCGGMTVVAWIKDGKIPFDAFRHSKNFVKTDALAGAPKILRAFTHTPSTSRGYEYMNIWIYKYMNIWIYENMNIWIYEYVIIYEYMNICIYVYMYIYIYMYVYIYMYTCLYVHMYMYIYIYIIYVPCSKHHPRSIGNPTKWRVYGGFLKLGYPKSSIAVSFL